MEAKRGRLAIVAGKGCCTVLAHMASEIGVIARVGEENNW
jgi:hypothetical protein